MVLKNVLLRSGSTAHQASEVAGYNVPGAFDAEDNEEVFYNDIISAGMGMADPKLVRILVENAKSRFEELRAWGLPCERTAQGFLGMQGCFSSRKRGYTIKGHGVPILEALTRQIRMRDRISVMENSMILDLIVHDGACVGAVGIDEKDETVFFDAGATVLAAGGASQVFLRNLNPPDVAGDSYALAYRAGVKLANMEFMQAGIGFSYPVSSLFQAYLWAAIPAMHNGSGKDVIQNYLPEGVSGRQAMREHCYHFPFSCRDISKIYRHCSTKRNGRRRRIASRGHFDQL
jgi:L-aspartate oxidase